MLSISILSLTIHVRFPWGLSRSYVDDHAMRSRLDLLTPCHIIQSPYVLMHVHFHVIARLVKPKMVFVKFIRTTHHGSPRGLCSWHQDPSSTGIDVEGDQQLPAVLSHFNKSFEFEIVE